jgi:hypothetical protein
VTFDLTGLSFNAAVVDNAPATSGINPSKQTFQVRLSQGSHVLQFPAYPGGPFTAFPFQVTSNGTVSYDNSQDGGVLTGAGTRTLGAISTATVTVDATATSYSSIGISGCGWYPGAIKHQCRLVPGNYSLDLQTYPIGYIPFRITSAGTISYDGTAASVLTGSGTSTLGVATKTITVDATASSYSMFELNAATGFRPAGTPWQYKLSPGTYALVLPTSVTNQYTEVLFTITSSGTVSYDTSQHPGWLTGAGTTTLHLMH